MDTSNSRISLAGMRFGSSAWCHRLAVLPGSGIVKAKGEGRYKGRKATARAKSVDIGLTKQGMTREKIANEDGVGVASVYRALKATAAVGETR